MPEKYADMLTHCGVPIATIVANGGKRRVTLDWSKLVFPLVVAIIMGFGGAAYNQAGLNGKVTATLDNVANALRDVSITNQSLQAAVVQNTTVINTLSELPKEVHNMEKDVAVLKSKARNP